MPQKIRLFAAKNSSQKPSSEVFQRVCNSLGKQPSGKIDFSPRNALLSPRKTTRFSSPLTMDDFSAFPSWGKSLCVVQFLKEKLQYADITKNSHATGCQAKCPEWPSAVNRFSELHGAHEFVCVSRCFRLKNPQ